MSSFIFRGIPVGSQYKLNVTVTVDTAFESSQIATIYISFNAMKDPGGMYQSKERTVICTVKIFGETACTKVTEIPMNIAYRGVSVSSMELPRLDCSIAVQVQITEPVQDDDECPMNLFLEQKRRMYRDGLQHGDIKLIPQLIAKEMDHEAVTQTKKRRKGGELEAIDKENASIKTFSFVLKSASSVFESILNTKTEGDTGKTLEIYD